MKIYLGTVKSLIFAGILFHLFVILCWPPEGRSGVWCRGKVVWGFDIHDIRNVDPGWKLNRRLAGLRPLGFGHDHGFMITRSLVSWWWRALSRPSLPARDWVGPTSLDIQYWQQARVCEGECSISLGRYSNCWRERDWWRRCPLRNPANKHAQARFLICCHRW
jgi:hypothetical protein